jgi:hypothetical protein
VLTTAQLRKEVQSLRATLALRTRSGAATLAAIRADRAAALTLAGFDPEPHQAAFLRSDAARELLLSCRQFGKSTVCAAKAVAEVLLVPGALVLLLAPSLRQSGELFLKGMHIYDRLGRPVPEVRRTATTLELANAGRLISLPGKAANIRGFSRPRLVLVDEAAFCDDALFVAASPMMARSSGTLALASSAYGQRGEFYRAWTQGASWRKTKVTADQCPAITPGFLEAEKKELGPRWYRQEYECEFVATLDCVFDPAAVEAALEADVRPLFLGAA